MWIRGVKERVRHSAMSRSAAAMLGVAAIGWVCAGGAVAARHHASGPAQAASNNRCYLTVYAPEIKYPKLWSRITSRCTANHRNVKLSVVLQVRRNGRWTAFRQAAATVDMKSGKTVTLRTDPFTCSAHPHKTLLRTYGKAVVTDANVVIAHPSPSWTLDCI